MKQLHKRQVRTATRSTPSLSNNTGQGTWHAVHTDAAITQVLRLLAAATKNIRVAALEAQHGCARVRKTAQQCVYLILCARVEALLLAHVHHHRAAVDELQDVR